MQGTAFEKDSFTETVSKLNAETDFEAAKRFREKQRVLLPVVLAKMCYKFMNAYLFQGKWRKGYFGFMDAVNKALYELVSYAKYWELRERERGRM